MMLKIVFNKETDVHVNMVTGRICSSVLLNKVSLISFDPTVILADNQRVKSVRNLKRQSEFDPGLKIMLKNHHQIQFGCEQPCALISPFILQHFMNLFTDKRS